MKDSTSSADLVALALKCGAYVRSTDSAVVLGPEQIEVFANRIRALAVEEPKPQAEPVAWRYKDSRGLWRYCTSRPHEAYEILLKPEPLYCALPVAADKGEQV